MDNKQRIQSRLSTNRLINAIDAIYEIFNAYKITVTFSNLEHSKPIKDNTNLKEQQGPGKLAIEFEFPVTDENVELYLDILRRLHEEKRKE